MENTSKFLGSLFGILVGFLLILNWNNIFETKQENATIIMIDGTHYTNVTLEKKTPISDWYLINDSISINKDNISSISFKGKLPK